MCIQKITFALLRKYKKKLMKGKVMTLASKVRWMKKKKLNKIFLSQTSIITIQKSMGNSLKKDNDFDSYLKWL